MVRMDRQNDIVAFEAMSILVGYSSLRWLLDWFLSFQLMALSYLVNQDNGLHGAQRWVCFPHIMADSLDFCYQTVPVHLAWSASLPDWRSQVMRSFESCHSRDYVFQRMCQSAPNCTT